MPHFVYHGLDGTPEMRPVLRYGTMPRDLAPEERQPRDGYRLTLTRALPPALPRADAFHAHGFNELTGEYVPRPLLDAVLPGPWPMTVPLDGWPAGSVVTIANEQGDELVLTDLSEPLILTDPGQYALRVVPPFPYLTLNQMVIVNA